MVATSVSETVVVDSASETVTATSAEKTTTDNSADKRATAISIGTDKPVVTISSLEIGVSRDRLSGETMTGLAPEVAAPVGENSVSDCSNTGRDRQAEGSSPPRHMHDRSNKSMSRNETMSSLEARLEHLKEQQLFHHLDPFLSFFLQRKCLVNVDFFYS